MTNRILLLLVFVLGFSAMKAQDSLSCTVPTGLFASTRDTIASLNWKSTGTNRAYAIQYKLRTESNWKMLTATSNTLTLTGLKPCAEYDFRVKSVCSMTSSSDYSESKSFKTSGCTAPCLSPKEVKAQAGDLKASVLWAANGSAGYEVQYQDLSNNGALVTAKVTTNSFSVANLKPCTKYSFKVRSICSNATTNSPVLYSDWSAAITVATTGCAVARCEAPRSVNVQVTANGVTVKWDSLKGVSYDLQVKSLKDTAWRSINGVRNNVYTFLAGLATCTVYEVRVRVNCSTTSSSVWSYPTRFTTTGCQTLCFAPRGLVATVSDSVVAVTWAGAQTAKYVLQYKADGDIDWKTMNVAGNIQILRGLARCKKYLVHVQSVCGSALVSDYSETITFQTACPTVECVTPNQLAAKVLDSLNSAILTWSPTGARGYVIEMKNLSSTSGDYKRDTVTLPYFTVKNLARCSKYAFRVSAICNNKITAPSEVFTFATAGCVDVCSIPVGLKAEILGDSIASVIWTAASDLVGKFEIQYRVGTDTTWKTLVAQASPFKFNLERCKAYAVRVRKICVNGASDWSEIFKFETKGCVNVEPCAIPTGLKSEVIGDSLASLGWLSTITAGTIGKYEIQFRVGADTTWKSITTQDAVLRLPLLRCQVYSWRVRKICVNGASDWSEVFKFETKGCVNIEPCAIPTGLKSEVIGDSLASLGWLSTTTVGTIGKYEIQFRVGADTTWKSITTQDAVLRLPLLRCQVYSWRVRKICVNGASDWSEIFKFETKCPQPCALPLDLKSTVVDSNVVLSWAGAVGKYEIQYRVGNDTATKSIITQSPGYQLTLKPCQVYYWRVRNLCVDAASDWSAINKFETTGCPVPVCDRPTSPKAIVSQDTIVVLTWVGGPGKYEIQYRAGTDSTYKLLTTTVSEAKLVLPRCKDFFWRVRRVCDLGVSDWSDITVFTTGSCPAPVCEIPVGLAAKVAKDTTATLAWTATNTIAAYEIQYALFNAAGVVVDWVSVPVTSPTYTLTGLKRCAVYQWRVRRLCSTTSASDWSPIMKFETSGCLTTNPCAAPLNVTVTQSIDFASVLWTDVPAGDSVFVEYYKTGDTIGTKLVGTTPNGVMIRAIQACTEYKLKVTHKCASGIFSTPVATSFKTTGANCFAGDGVSSQLKMANTAVKNVNISPNPGDEYVQVQYDLNETSDIKIQVVSLQGQVVKQVDGGTQEAGVYSQQLSNMSEINQGMYFIVIRANDKVMTTQKWMKQ